jgi:hypothetical protein
VPEKIQHWRQNFRHFCVKAKDDFHARSLLHLASWQACVAPGNVRQPILLPHLTEFQWSACG